MKPFVDIVLQTYLETMREHPDEKEDDDDDDFEAGGIFCNDTE